MENTPSSAPKVTSRNLRIFLAVKDSDQRSRMEDNLVMDGFDVRTFSAAATLWDAFQQRPARMVITERRFGGGLSRNDAVAERIGADFPSIVSR